MYIVQSFTSYKMHPENTTKCPGCGVILQEYQFKKHLKKCEKYPGLALRKIRKLPNDMSPLELKMIIAEIDICREEVQDILHSHYENNKPTGVISSKIKSGRGSMIQAPEIDLTAFDQDIVSCNRCKRKFYASYDISSLFYVEQCWHLFCKACMGKIFDEQFIKNGGSLQCMAPGCKKNVSQYSLKNLVGQKKFQASQAKAIRKLMNIIQCTKCKSQFEFVPGNSRDAPPKDQNGKPLSAQQKQHYAENRFVCSQGDCKAQQCKQCKAIPFHTGMTCEKFKQRAQMKKCRYCDEPLTSKNSSNTSTPALKDICNSKQCQQLAKGACTKMLACGHPCPGFKGQNQCLPCLQQECCKNNEDLNGQSGDDYCNICFIEALTASPCIRSACGHIFHQKCIKKRYQIKWLTPRILFNFCLCPLCKKWINLPEENSLSPEIQKNSDLFNKIQNMSLERLKFEDDADDKKKLQDPKSPYYQKPNEYAMAVYAYFMCFKCKKPYFGGRKSCADAMNEPQNQDAFKPQQLVCPNCCDIPIENCPKHGKDFIQFKCKFCCSTAQWFCWGNTHFCQPCHKRQCSGDYVSKYTKDKLPKCPGPGKCPIGGNHNGNGQQKTLGCAICRNYKANSKNF